MSPKMGRPFSDNPKSAKIEIRITPLEKAEIMSFTKESGYGLLELIRIGMETVKKNNGNAPT